MKAESFAMLIHQLVEDRHGGNVRLYMAQSDEPPTRALLPSKPPAKIPPGVRESRRQQRRARKKA